jgi:hypothetical protein
MLQHRVKDTTASNEMVIVLQKHLYRESIVDLSQLIYQMGLNSQT